MSDSNIKGRSIGEYLNTIKDLFGADARRKVEEKLPAETLAIAADKALQKKWVDIAHLEAVYQAMIDELFDGDVSRVEEVGRHKVRNDISGPFRVFLKVVSPQYLASHFESFWRLYNDTGSVKLLEQGKKSAHGAVYFEKPHPAFWRDILGGFAGALEAAGAENVKVQVLHGGEKNDSMMEFQVTWD